MSEELRDMLRIIPQCEVVVGEKRCKENGTIHMVVTHEKRNDVQKADMCRKHSGIVAEKARKQGYKVEFTK